MLGKNFLFLAYAAEGHLISIKVKALKIGMMASLFLRTIHTGLLPAKFQLS